MADDEQPRSPLAEEAVRLVGAVQEWARQTFPAGPDGHMGAECQWCPLCQFMAVVRGEHPELTERVAEAGSAVASAFRAMLEATSAAASGASGAAASGGASGSSPEPQPRVQRIDLGSDDPGGTDAPRASDDPVDRDE